jgi:cytochrome P450
MFRASTTWDRPQQTGAGVTEQSTLAFDRFTPAAVADPYPLYDHVRDSGPFLDTALGMWIVGRYDDVRVVLSDHERFSSDFNIRSPQWPSPEVAAVLATGFPEVHVLLNQDPPDHTAVRALVSGTFSPRRVRELTPTVQRLATGLIDRFAAAGRADLIGELAWPLPLDVICELLGLPVADALQIRSWIDALTGLTSYGTTPDRQIELAHESVAFEHYLAGFIAARRSHPRDDLTSELLASTLSDLEMISLLVNLIFAGHETTSNLIGNTLLALLTAGPIVARPSDDQIDAAVDETMRRDPPVQGMFRLARTDVELDGVTIPAGSMIFALMGAANRDPKAYADPDAFDPGRSGPPHLGFGRGVHYCVGAQLARMEARVVLRTLLARLPGLRLAPGFTPPYLPNLMHRGPRRLDVTWTP